jgi:hypothetical protein
MSHVHVHCLPHPRPRRTARTLHGAHISPPCLAVPALPFTPLPRWSRSLALPPPSPSHRGCSSYQSSQSVPAACLLASTQPWLDRGLHNSGFVHTNLHDHTNLHYMTHEAASGVGQWIRSHSLRWEGGVDSYTKLPPVRGGGYEATLPTGGEGWTGVPGHGRCTMNGSVSSGVLGYGRCTIAESVSLSFLVAQVGIREFWHLYAGVPRDDSVSAAFWRSGASTCVDFDYAHGQRQNILLPRVRALLMHALVELRLSLGLVGGPNCRSFSPGRPTIRPRTDPLGQHAAAADRGYLDDENMLFTFYAALCWRAFQQELEFLVENPADLGDLASPVFRLARAGAASLFTTPPYCDLALATGAVAITGPQCKAFGTPWRKLTTWLASPRLAVHLAWIGDTLVAPFGCDCGRHAKRAWGRDAFGRSLAKASAAWNGVACSAIVAALLAVARGDPARAHCRGSTGGRISDGPSLHPTVAAAVEVARTAPPRHTSMRSLPEATDQELDLSPFPSMPSVGAEANDAARARQASPVAQVEGDLGSGSDTSEEGDAVVPPHPLHISRIPKRRSWARVQRWLRLAEPFLRAKLAGLATDDLEDPGVCVVTQRQTREWARWTKFDCRDPHACVWLQPSTRDTLFPGPRQMDREAFRATARKHGWSRVDPDILAQAGEGGVEARTSMPWFTVLRLHHPDLYASPHVASKAIEAELRDGVALAVPGMLPFWPTGCVPRDIAWAERSRMVTPEPTAQQPVPVARLESYWKPRLTLDPTSGSGSMNDGIADAERTVNYPKLQSFTRGAAMADSAARRAGLRASAYAADVKSAFPHLVLQRLDWVFHCFIWICPVTQSLIVCYLVRTAFGGAYAPQRFCRVMALMDAEVDERQAAFNAAHPPPEPMLRWMAERRDRQRLGHLPLGAYQLFPSARQRFVDDAAGAADTGIVPCPPSLAHIGVGPEATALAGGTPAPEFSRVAVLCRIEIGTWEDHGITHEPDKTVCGDPIVSLGTQVGIIARRIVCPGLKAAAILRQLRDIAAEASTPMGTVDVPRIAQATGRLTAISLHEPGLLGILHGGYTVVAAGMRAGRRHRPAQSIRMSEGSRATRELRVLARDAIAIVEANLGIPLASPARAPHITAPGNLTGLTDASRAAADDGVGGFGSHACVPHITFVVCEPWPADVKTALDILALPRADRPSLLGRATLSMPSAETFGCWAWAVAVHAACRLPTCSVTAIGDCDPAAAAINKGSSPVPQLRAILMHMRKLTTAWLGVSVPRDFNFDADRLSHPSQLPAILRELRASGQEAVVVRIPDWVWGALREAMLLSPDDPL